MPCIGHRKLSLVGKSGARLTWENGRTFPAKLWSSPKNWRVQQTTIDIPIAVFSLCCCFIVSIAVIVPLRVKGLPSNISIAVVWLGGAEGNGRKVAVHAQTRPCLVGGPDQRLDL